MLWPVLRRTVGDGHGLTLQVEQEQEVNELVIAIEQGRPEDPGRAEILTRLIEVLREDVRDEEDTHPNSKDVSTGGARPSRGWCPAGHDAVP